MKEDDFIIKPIDASWAAGLFDGEGCVTYKKYYEKKTKKGKSNRYLCQRICLEVAMTCEATVRYFHSIVLVGTVNKKSRAKTGHKMQWRWRCTFRDAYLVAKLFSMYSVTKQEALQNVIDHYEETFLFKNKDGELFDKNNSADILDLNNYRFWKKGVSVNK